VIAQFEEIDARLKEATVLMEMRSPAGTRERRMPTQKPDGLGLGCLVSEFAFVFLLRQRAWNLRGS
jgi:hypothetical protein